MSETTLQHYGVLGMKWGVRKDPDRAYSRGSKKLRKLDTKLVKRTSKANRAEEKMIRAKSRATTVRKMRKAQKFEAKYNKMVLKTNKSRAKAVNWYKKMEQVFNGIELDNVNQADVELGRAYAQMIFSEIRTRGKI